MKKISVVIPYFQRKNGILSKAVQSALDQQGIGDLEILIVDKSCAGGHRARCAFAGSEGKKK